jgi:hypothetical protein
MDCKPLVFEDIIVIAPPKPTGLQELVSSPPLEVMMVVVAFEMVIFPPFPPGTLQVPPSAFPLAFTPSLNPVKVIF